MTNIWIGIDISKGHMDVTALDDAGSTVFSGKYLDTALGHEALSRIIDDSLTSISPIPVVHIGMESSGGYERNWARWAKGEEARLAFLTQVKVYVLNPLAVKRYLARELHRTTTDAHSAHGIAEYLAHGMRLADTPYMAELEGAISYYRAIRSMIARSASMATELAAILVRTHPELVQYCRSGIPAWVLTLLTRYSTSAHLARARAATLAQIPSLTQARATAIVAAAKKSVASLSDPYTQLCIETMVADLRQARERIAAEKRRVIELFGDDPVVRLLSSIPGIGTWSAICLRLELGTIERFPSSAALISYTGLDPVVAQSGDITTHRGISKRGKSRIRAILYMCANAAVQSNPVVQALYARLEERGKKPMVRVVACMRKLVELVYACWISGTPFDPKHWERHCERVREMRERAEKRVEARPLRVTPQELKETLSAPLSRREANKRKATAVPQRSLERLVRGPGAASRVGDEQGGIEI